MKQKNSNKTMKNNQSMVALSSCEKTKHHERHGDGVFVGMT